MDPRLARLAEIADAIRELTHEQTRLLEALANELEGASFDVPAAAELRPKTGTNEGGEQ